MKKINKDNSKQIKFKTYIKIKIKLDKVIK